MGVDEPSGSTSRVPGTRTGAGRWTQAERSTLPRTTCGLVHQRQRHNARRGKDGGPHPRRNSRAAPAARCAHCGWDLHPARRQTVRKSARSGLHPCALPQAGAPRRPRDMCNALRTRNGHRTALGAIDINTPTSDRDHCSFRSSSLRGTAPCSRPAVPKAVAINASCRGCEGHITPVPRPQRASADAGRGRILGQRVVPHAQGLAS